MSQGLEQSRYGHTSTVITIPSSYTNAIALLTQFDWLGRARDTVIILGERKTSRVTILALSPSDTAPGSLTLALERLSPTLDPSHRAAVLTHDLFDVEILDVGDVPLSQSLAVRLTRLSVVTGGVPRLVKIGKTAVDRLRRASPGFVGAVGMTHSGSGKAIFVEFFVNRAALRESEVTAYFDSRSAREAGILVEPPEHEVYQLYPYIRTTEDP